MTSDHKGPLIRCGCSTVDVGRPTEEEPSHFSSVRSRTFSSVIRRNQWKLVLPDAFDKMRRAKKLLDDESQLNVSV